MSKARFGQILRGCYSQWDDRYKCLIAHGTNKAMLTDEKIEKILKRSVTI